jgi:hypothetical protein
MAAKKRAPAKLAKDPVCRLPECTEPPVARGLCVGHWEDLARGRPFRPPGLVLLGVDAAPPRPGAAPGEEEQRVALMLLNARAG